MFIRASNVVLLSLALMAPSWSVAEDASVSTSQANLRVAADGDARVITALPRGTELEILDREGAYARVRVKRTGISGWVYAPAQKWGGGKVVAEDSAPSVNASAATPAPQAPAAPANAGETIPLPARALAPAPVAAPPFRSAPALTPIELRLSMEALDSEVVFRKEPFDRSSFPVRILDGGTASAGRVEVTGSFSRRFIKKSLLINLADGARWRDNSRVSLKAMATDPSYMRGWASWDLAHVLGMVAPQTEMVRLFINDQFVGPFMFFDWIDADMMERQGQGRDGALYHPIDSVFCGGLGDATLDVLKTCWNQFAPKGGDFSELQTLARELAETPAAAFDRYLESRFDADSVINWIVLNTITSNTDSYNKNYFLYLSRKTGKWVVVPWDYDLSFGRNADPALPFPKSILNDNFQYFYTPELGNANPLKEKLLRNPALYQRFKARLAHVLGVERDPAAAQAAFGWFEPEAFRARLVEWARVLEIDVSHDHYRAHTAEEFREHVEALDYYNLVRFHLLRHQVLGTTVFGTARWLPYTSYPPLQAPAADAPVTRQHTPLDLAANATLSPGTARVVPVDEQFSRPLGVFEASSLGSPVRVRIEAETERAPAMLPEAKRAEQCIQRTWFVDLKTPGTAVTTRLTVDYLEETSVHHELGAQVAEQTKLALWANTGGAWQQLPTHANPRAKTLTAEALALAPGQVVRLVACVP